MAPVNATSGTNLSTVSRAASSIQSMSSKRGELIAQVTAVARPCH
jgi:hypothetical protein